MALPVSFQNITSGALFALTAVRADRNGLEIFRRRGRNTGGHYVDAMLCSMWASTQEIYAMR
jgi:hypothetical protein